MTTRRQLAATFGPAYYERQRQVAERARLDRLRAEHGARRYGRAALRPRWRRRRRHAARMHEPWRGLAQALHIGMAPIGAILRRVAANILNVQAKYRNLTGQPWAGARERQGHTPTLALMDEVARV